LSYVKEMAGALPHMVPVGVLILTHGFHIAFRVSQTIGVTIAQWLFLDVGIKIVTD